MSLHKLFEPSVLLPSRDADIRLSNLVGLDDTISYLTNCMGILINPQRFKKWIEVNYADRPADIFNIIRERHNFIIFSGDVGTGKTELAETIGSKVARSEKIEITLYKLSLASRGSGRVGEMTELISSAFDSIINEAETITCKGEQYQSGIVFFIDEADAIAQSRELDQMHHEDRAGVNALIRGIDRLHAAKLPVIIIMCTNRADAVDPAVKRRASEIIYFTRPNAEQRKSLFSKILMPFNLSDSEINKIVDLTGTNDKRDYGYSYSDIRQRLIPSVIYRAYPTEKVTLPLIIDVISKIEPTPIFKV